MLNVIVLSGILRVYGQPQSTVITGRVRHANPTKTQVIVTMNRVGFPATPKYVDLDAQGQFSGTFFSEVPTDVWIRYRTNFLVLTHPGDSLFVEFDGRPQKRASLLETIQFAGNAAQINREAAAFQQRYFASDLYQDWDAKRTARKDYDPQQYLRYLERRQQHLDTLWRHYVLAVKPQQETADWSQFFIEQDFYDGVALYPHLHRRANHLSRTEWEVPVTFYDHLLERLPLNEATLINGYNLSSFINRFYFRYIQTQIWNDPHNTQYVTKEGNVKLSKAGFDSLMVYGVIHYTPDPFLRQLVLTELFEDHFEESDAELFEKYRAVAKQHITQSYLWEPLVKDYQGLVYRLNHPQMASDAVLKQLKASSARQIIKQILSNNRGKVIYVDLWAPWCGPCRAEMPYAKHLMKRVSPKQVAFVYLCLDSKKSAWKQALADLQIGGQQYFLSSEQSAALRNRLNVQGVPYYLLFDAQGTLREKGTQLRPEVVEPKIHQLLN